MQSWQLQGAACCGITRGLHRASGDGARDDIAFALKLFPRDFCVNEISIDGIVADVDAAAARDEIPAPEADAAPELSPARGIPDSARDESESARAPPESSAEMLRSCFAVDAEWNCARAALADIAPTFFSNSKPHGLFPPQLLLLSETARADKDVRKRAYNVVRAMFPFVAMTTPSPPGTHCRLALDLFICDLPAFFDADDAAAVCNFLNTSMPDGSSAFERDQSSDNCSSVAVARGQMQKWPRIHEFVRTRARFLKAEEITKQGPDDDFQPHILLSRTPSRKRKRSPSKPVIYTEFVLKKVNIGSDEAISQVAAACGVSRHVFSRFGTKDKAAVTQQFVVARDLEASFIAQRCRNLQDATVGCFRRVSQPAALGDSLGNQFIITLRRCQPSVNAVYERLQRCSSGQFVNYYGVQRVGEVACALQCCTSTGAWACVDLLDLDAVVSSRGIKNDGWKTIQEGSQMHLAGWCAVQHQWAGFAACVLARSGRSGGLGHAMRDFCVAGNANALVKQLDKHRQPQHAVAMVLAKGGWSAAASVAAEVDRSYLVLAVNTLQSVLFNRLAAHRVSLGLSVMPSDLVELSDGSVGPVSTSSRQHSIDDVMLPLVGTKTLLPSYAADIFSSNPPDMALAALTSPPSECDAAVSSATKKAVGQPGSYRRMIARARAFECKIMDDSNFKSGNTAVEAESEQVIRVQFELAAGCYATSFLFEMCIGEGVCDVDSYKKAQACVQPNLPAL